MRRRKFSPIERAFVRERAGGCCEYCRFPFDFSHDAFHIEHIISLLLGGTDELENLAFACDGCNSLKWVHIVWPDPKTGLKTPLFNPRKDEWPAHFEWSEDLATIFGTTPEGRATVDLLKMNRPGLVNVRNALRVYGAHPAQKPG